MRSATAMTETAPLAFYGGGDREKVLEQLEHLALWSHSVTLLTGPAGAGKTTLLSRLIAQLRLRGVANLVSPDVSVLTTPRELLLQLAEALGVDAGVASDDDDADAMLQRLLVQNAAAERASERPTLVVVDDAHELSPDVLQGLCALISAAVESRALHVLLAGDRNLRSRLDVRVDAHEIKLKPFGYHELRSFARESDLIAVGALDESEMQAIYKRSGGWPGAVVSEWYREVRRRGAGRRVPYALVAGIALTAALLVTALAVTRFKGPGNDSTTTARDVEPVVVPGQATPAAAPALVPVDGDAPVRMEPQLSAPVVDTGVAPTTSPGAIAPRAESGELPERPAAAEPTALAPAAAAPSRAATPPSATAAPVPPKPAPAAAPGSGETISDASAWARAQPASSFTLQLAGLSRRSAAERLVRDYAAHGARLVHTRRGGEDWHIVLVGSFGTRSAALAAAGNLPPTGPGQKPWVRTFDGIHGELR